jgi:hypothetical protein
MLFAATMPSGLEGPSAPDALVDAGGPRPVVHWQEGPGSQGEPPRDALDAWAAATRALLDGLLRRGRAKAAPAKRLTPGRTP